MYRVFACCLIKNNLITILCCTYIKYIYLYIYNVQIYIYIYILWLKKKNKNPCPKDQKKFTKDTFFNSIQVRSTSDATNWRTPDVLNVKFTSKTSPNSSFGPLLISFSNTVRYTYRRRSYTRVNMLHISAWCIWFCIVRILDETCHFFFSKSIRCPFTFSSSGHISRLFCVIYFPLFVWIINK